VSLSCASVTVTKAGERATTPASADSGNMTGSAAATAGTAPFSPKHGRLKSTASSTPVSPYPSPHNFPSVFSSTVADGHGVRFPVFDKISSVADCGNEAVVGDGDRSGRTVTRRKSEMSGCADLPFRDLVMFQPPVGRGQFGSVCRAEWRGSRRG
jgi:hypothetical protein